MLVHEMGVNRSESTIWRLLKKSTWCEHEQRRIITQTNAYWRYSISEHLFMNPFLFHDHHLINFSARRFVCFSQSRCCKIAECSNIQITGLTQQRANQSINQLLFEYFSFSLLWKKLKFTSNYITNLRFHWSFSDGFITSSQVFKLYSNWDFINYSAPDSWFPVNQITITSQKS